jgi:hypothetical protein
MPDRGVSIGDPIITAGHVATPQWQSFELRMRHRRADRCVQRAAAAIEAGRLDEASEALAEAQGLNPVASGLDDLLQRLNALRPEAPSMVGPVQVEGGSPLDTQEQRHELHAAPSVETETSRPIDLETVAAPIAPETVAAPIARDSVAPPIEIESVASAMDMETAALQLDAGTGGAPVVPEPVARPIQPTTVASAGETRTAGPSPNENLLARPAVTSERFDITIKTVPPARDKAVHPPLELDAIHDIDVEDSYPIDLRSVRPIGVEDVPPIRFEAVNPLDLDVEQDPALPIEVLKAPEPAARNHSTLAAVAVAMLALLLSGAAGWLAWSQWPMNAAQQARAEIPQAPTVVPQTPAPAPAPSPAPAPPATDAPVQSSEVSEPVPSPPQEDRPEIVTEPTPSVARAVPDPEPRDTRPAPPAAENTSSRPLAPPTAPPAATSTTGTRTATPPTVSPTPEANPATPESSAASAARPSDVPPRTVVEEAPRPAVPAPSSGVSTMPGPPATTVDPPAAPPAEAPRPTAPVVDEHAAVRATLGRYESAYSDLNTAAAHAVWPGVDERALARAFDSLSSQRVKLGTCEVGVNGATARAICHGTASWTPKVGGGQQTKSRTWTFDLRQTRGTWQIVRVDAR